MTTFVLVHGSYSGGWVWRWVKPKLEEAGHEVYTPTLTGLGERHHLVSPRTGLDVHIQDIVGVFEYEDLSDVVLVGHSYGGMVITGVAEACADRIARLVYFDGFVPEDGQSCWDIVDTKSRWEEAAREMGTDWLSPPPDPTVKNDDLSDEQMDWMRERKTPMPIWTHGERIQIPENRAADLPRTFISCTHYETFQPTAKKARAGDFDYHELDTGHAAYLSAPDELAAIFLEAAELAAAEN
ncbi:MAG: alpha/beta fold hydrolase [Halobacteriota archaeon]